MAIGDLLMNMLKYFFECYFNQSYNFEELDHLIQEFRTIEKESCIIEFINELHLIIQAHNYHFAAKIIKKHGGRFPNSAQTEELIKYIYNTLTNRAALLNIKNFIKDCNVVFCPVCTPDTEAVTQFSLIERAAIIKNDKQIYICKPCKLVWTTKDIRAENAQDYKKFMKSLGLKGLWNELRDVDLL